MTRKPHLPLLLLAACALLTSACATAWPTAIPEPDDWQLRSVQALPYETPSRGEPRTFHLTIAYVYGDKRGSLDAAPIFVAPPRLDVVCSDNRQSDSSGAGRGTITFRFIPDERFLADTPVTDWVSASLEFTSRKSDYDLRNLPLKYVAAGSEITFGSGANEEQATISSSSAWVDGQDDTQEVIQALRDLSDSDDGRVIVEVVFGVDEDTERQGETFFEFPIDKESNAKAALQALFSNCGQEW